MSEEIQATMDFSGSLIREMDLAFEETNDCRFDRQHYVVVNSFRTQF